LLQSETLNSLKDMLRANNQPVGGKKDELIMRIAACKIKGALQKCPECFGGNLEYNPKTGKYKCKGFFDDTDYKSCSFSGVEKDVKRNPWVNPVTST